MATIPAHENEFPEVLLSEGAAPAAPGSGLVKMYAKSDGLPYSKDDAGAESPMTPNAHIADTSDAHDASAISIADSGALYTATDVEAALAEVMTAVGAGGIPATIVDNKAELIAGTAADTVDNVPPPTVNDQVLAAASGESTGLQWQSRSKFKRTVLNGNGNKTTTSTTFVAVDTTNLGYLTLDLAVGDVVRCSLHASIRHSSGSANGGLDFEVDQPTSADTRIGSGTDYGVAKRAPSIERVHIGVVGYFTATEAGSHGFRPMWKTDSGTATMCNASSADDDVTIQFCVEKLGAPA